MSNPTVSVIMNCYNSDTYLKQAIDSVYAQTFSDWEIIFWDNQSTDSSANIAQSYDEKLRYFLSDMHTSLGAGRNAALTHIRGKYIAFLDCDDSLAPTRLAQQVAIMEANADIGLAYSNFYVLKNEHIRKMFYAKQPEGYIFDKALAYYSVGIVTVLLRKDCLEKLNPVFDEHLSLAEDFDTFMRILYYTKAAYIHEPLAYYRWHSTMSTIRRRKEFPDEIIYVINKLRTIPSLSDTTRTLLNTIEQREKTKKIVELLREGSIKKFVTNIAHPTTALYCVYFAYMRLQQKFTKLISIIKETL